MSYLVNRKEPTEMKKDVHPQYVASTITCACGHVYRTRSTRGSFMVEICANCHPFFTGKQKFIDTAGRVDRFNKRYGRGGDKPATETKG
jgi:large subunit ribosomal protein L31